MTGGPSSHHQSAIKSGKNTKHAVIREELRHIKAPCGLTYHLSALAIELNGLALQG
jgi:hypothetical protein